MTESEQSRPAKPGVPVMLFDGVCNLCNAAVQWVIERDPQARIRFASLQSEAAARQLGRLDVGAEQLPDSIVLVDGDAVRTRSDAAIAVARRLGFPYSMLALGLILPRPVRDAIYETVARNRYRWFGRRDRCMVPSPELAERFLDAGESPRLVPESEPAARADRRRPRSWLVAWAPRFAISYVLAYMAPFPLTLLGYLVGLPLVGSIPGLGAVIGWVVGLHGQIVNPIVSWVGSAAFGVEIAPAFTGSGDMTFNYVDLLVDVVLALLISVAWTAASRRRAVSARALDVSRTVARYYLGTTMLTYGWAKVFPLQFPLPGPDRLMQPYGDSSPMGLAWTFLGASIGYQIFAGLSELLGGYLLLWRRTALLGSLVAAAVMTNVMAINFFYDVPVKLFSSHLVLVALFIAAPEVARLMGLFVFNLPVASRPSVPFWHRPGRRPRRVMALHLIAIAVLTFVNVSGGISATRTRGVLAPPDPLTGIYRVEMFQQGGLLDRDNEDAARWVRVGLNAFVVTIQRASGDAVRMRAAIDREAGTMSLFDRGAPPPVEPTFTFSVPEQGVLRLEGRFEGKPTLVIMRRDPTGALLVRRGFHWINEYPFNR